MQPVVALLLAALRSTRWCDLEALTLEMLACRCSRGFLDGLAPDPLVGFPSGFVVRVSIRVPFVLLASPFMDVSLILTQVAGSIPA